jgi:hypothetical protein
LSLRIVFLVPLLFFLKITPITPILTLISLILCVNQNRIRKLRFMTAKYRAIVNSTSHHRIPVSKGLLASNGLISHLEDEAENLKTTATKNGGQHDQNNQDEEDEEEEEADFNEESDDVSSCSGFISII